MEHAFGSGQPFTVGVEEELLLVGAGGRELRNDAGRALQAMEPDGWQAAHEAYAAQLELRSPASADAANAVGALGAARAAAGQVGATLVGAGLHPTAPLGEVELVDADRYRVVEREMRGLIRRTPECALHVHVGMSDPETAIRAFNGLREWLPLLQGLAANSPWWFGIDSGMASARAAVVRSYPGRGVPPAFRDFDDYAETLARTADAGGPGDYTMLWWDLRPHPRLGTVEVREMDAQSRLSDVEGIAALVRVLGRHEAEAPARPPVPSDALAWSAFRAARDGLDARILHRGRVVPLRRAAREALDGLPAEESLEGVERILREGGGADRRRAAHARGGIEAMLEELVSETAEPAGRR